MGRITCLVMTTLGIMLMIYAASINGEDDWTPVTRPYPGTGFRIKDSFEITTDTNYWLQVSVPEHRSGEIGLPDKPPLECVLHIKITSNSVTYIDDTVKQLTYGGEEGFAHIDLYYSDKSWHLKRGEYELEISSEKTPEIISTHGALLELEQIVNPVGPLLRDKFRWFGAYLLCGLGMFGLVCDAFMRSRKSAPPAD